MSPNPESPAILDPPTDLIQPAEGEGIPGEVNIEWYKTALDSLQPDRFHAVRPLHDKCAHDECPVLVAHDKQSRADVLLQVFTTLEEFKRVRECAIRCCKLRVADCEPLTPGSPISPGSPGSTRPKRELMICRITEVHADPVAEQWCAVLEPALSDKGGDTLEVHMRDGLLDKGRIRQAFIRAARAVQTLHHAGLVHNAICSQNVIRVKSGLKLGNYAGLQRQGEERRSSGPGHGLCSPEKAFAEQQGNVLLCDFATDVWCLGLMLHELVSGVAWDAGRSPSEVAEELLAGEVAALPCLNKLGDSEEADEVRALVARMLTKHPMQRPVVDIVVQEAISKLYVEHDLEPREEVVTPVSPVTPTRQRLASPVPQRPAGEFCSDSGSPVSERGEGACGEPEHEISWEGTAGATGKLMGNDAPITSHGELPPQPACSCRCAVM